MSSSFPSFGSTASFADEVAIFDDSLMVRSEGVHDAYEFRRINGLWFPANVLLRPSIPNLNPAYGMAYDGETLMISHPQAPQRGQVLFRERNANGAWDVTQVVTAFQLGVDPNSSGSSFGRLMGVDGDVAAISFRTALVNGFQGVGSVFIMRRAANTWVLEQRIDHPYPTRRDLNFGTELALHGDELFVGGLAEGWESGTQGLVGAIFAYRRSAAGVWELQERIDPTIGQGVTALGPGFGSEFIYVPPTLFVGVPGWVIPGAGPGSPTGGSGTIFAFERCDGGWSQHVAMTAPQDIYYAYLGSGGIAYDGRTLVTGGPYYSGYFGQYHPNQYTFNAGIVAAIDYTPSASNACLEIGRPTCQPATSETRDCPCGAAVPGRGCPNAAGPGARLAFERGFNQVEFQRAVIDGLPPGTTTILTLGRPGLALPAGHVYGDGVVCIAAPIHWIVGVSDGSGIASFEHVATPTAFQLANLSYLELPFQALYQTSTPGPCGSTWNASNAVLLHLDRY
ncbi:MAG: hypothetical protein R3F49_18180 [Planctomycetota bacterium]